MELFDNPFTFSRYISQNEKFQTEFLKICGQTYERPKIVVIKRYSENIRYGSIEWVVYVSSRNEVFKTYPEYVENIPTEKEIAKNRKIYEFWQSTNEQQKKGGVK